VISRAYSQSELYSPAPIPDSAAGQRETGTSSVGQLNRLRKLLPGLNRKLDPGDLILALIVVFLYAEKDQEEMFLVLALLFLL